MLRRLTFTEIMPFHYKDEPLSFFGENNPWNPTEHTRAIFGQNAGFSAVKLDGNFSYPLSFIKV